MNKKCLFSSQPRKKCFVKEKGKKESLKSMRLPYQQKGNGIKEGRVHEDMCLCRSLFAAFMEFKAE